MLQSAPGSVAQVRECSAQLTRHAKRSGTALFIIGHVTKEGAIAGPRVLEHIVDTVLYFEGDPHSAFRLVRAVKNRFGAVNELGVFAMTDKGLRAVTNPSAFFLSRHGTDVAGSCVLATLEGTRPLLVEIQALVDSAHAPNPRRLTVGPGAEPARHAARGAAPARRHRDDGPGRVRQRVGGVRIGEPAADLAVSLAVVSSLTNRPIPGKLVVFGEVGLAGEVRPAPRGQDRLKEAAKLGFERAIVPRANAPKAKDRRARSDRHRAHRRSRGRVAQSLETYESRRSHRRSAGNRARNRAAVRGGRLRCLDHGSGRQGRRRGSGKDRAGGREGDLRPADVSQAEQIERWIEQTVEQLGCPNVLVNNAGIGRRAPFLELTTTDFDRVIAVNLRGTFLSSQSVARRMIGHASGWSHHQHRVDARVHVRARDRGVYGVEGRNRCADACDGDQPRYAWHPRELHQSWLDRNARLAIHSARAKAGALRARPAAASGRSRGQAGDIADACLFVAEQATFMTGQNITLDGGMTVKMIYEE
jgi:NAD(P)-dependent dehydrogenase (short-subunit alcohol dehydrogenase family)